MHLAFLWIYVNKIFISVLTVVQEYTISRQRAPNYTSNISVLSECDKVSGIVIRTPYLK